MWNKQNKEVYIKALIIAAGDGTRMQPVTRGRHKSLMPLLGLKIIERVILASKQAGIVEFVIVVGYQGDSFRKYVGNGNKYGVTITYIENKRWHKANGLSVLKAKGYFKENFVLLMSDHVFDYKTLEKIQRLKLRGNECVLAIDRKMNSVLDVGDTTKTKVAYGKVRAIGKSLEKYNAYDCGMFICSPYIFQVLEKTTFAGKNSLTNGMSILVREGLLRAFDIKGRFWSDCDTWQDIKLAEKKLLSSLTKREDGTVSKLINRKFSTIITKYLVRTSITPNIVSMVIPIIAPIALVMLAQGKYPWILFGGLLIQFASIVDGCDGELARLKFQKSQLGVWLDPIIDRYIDSILIIGMSIGFWNVTQNMIILPITVFLMFLLMLDDYIPNKFKAEIGRKLIFEGLRFKRDTRLLILAIGAASNHILASFLILMFVTQYKIVIKLLAGRKMLSQPAIVAKQV